MHRSLKLPVEDFVDTFMISISELRVSWLIPYLIGSYENDVSYQQPLFKIFIRRQTARTKLDLRQIRLTIFEAFNDLKVKIPVNNGMNLQ